MNIQRPQPSRPWKRLISAVGFSVVLGACGADQNPLAAGDQGVPRAGFGAPACGDFRLENHLMPPAEDPAAAAVEVLSPPYVATMGGRVQGPRQVADVRLVWEPVAPDEPLSMEFNGHDYGVLLPPEPGIDLRRGSPGEYAVSLKGQKSGCVTQFEMTYVLDTVLRAIDAERGLTEPAPPDEKFPFERFDP